MALGAELYSCCDKIGPAVALHGVHQQAGLSHCVLHAANGTDAVYFTSGIALGAFRTPGASRQACSMLCSPALWTNHPQCLPSQTPSLPLVCPL